MWPLYELRPPRAVDTVAHCERVIQWFKDSKRPKRGLRGNARSISNEESRRLATVRSCQEAALPQPGRQGHQETGQQDWGPPEQLTLWRRHSCSQHEGGRGRVVWMPPPAFLSHSLHRAGRLTRQLGKNSQNQPTVHRKRTEREQAEVGTGDLVVQQKRGACSSVQPFLREETWCSGTARPCVQKCIYELTPLLTAVGPLTS